MKLRARWAVLVFGLLATFAVAQSTAPVDASAPIAKRGNARFYELHATHLKRAKEAPIGLLFVGDSITERWVQVPEIWKENFESYQPANFGIGGDQTHHVIWRIEDGVLDGLKPKVVVLLIGTNNTHQHTAGEIAAANEKIIRLIQAKIPEAKVLLMAIFPRGPRVNRQGVVLDDAVKRMEVIRAVNPLLAKLADGERVRFLDIGEKFVGPDGKIPSELMPDQVHLSPDGYRIWAAALRPVLDEMMR